MTLLSFDVEDLDAPITLKSPSWAAFAAWYDEWMRNQEGDADHNLVIACASEPGAEGLAEIFEDGFGFLPSQFALELLTAGGLPGGWMGGFAPENRIKLVSLKEAEGNHLRAAELLAIVENETNEEKRQAAANEHLQLALVPQTFIDSVRGKSRRLFFAQLPSGQWWALRAPGSSDGARYQTESMAALRGEGSLANVGRALLLKCVLSPSREIAEAEIDDLPGIVPRLVPTLREKAGEGKAIARAKT